MRFEIAAAALIAGFAAAAPQAAVGTGNGQVTSTMLVTNVVTITSCASTVTSCPARTSTNVYAVTTVLPVVSQKTSTIMKTDVITITSCAPTVTNCPARTSTTTYPVVTTIPVVGKPGLSTGSSNNNNNKGTGSLTYNMPSATGYKGPSFTGAANSLNAGAALAGVGAVAALLL